MIINMLILLKHYVDDHIKKCYFLEKIKINICYSLKLNA